MLSAVQDRIEELWARKHHLATFEERRLCAREIWALQKEHRRARVQAVKESQIMSLRGWGKKSMELAQVVRPLPFLRGPDGGVLSLSSAGAAIFYYYRELHRDPKTLPWRTLMLPLVL